MGPLKRDNWKNGYITFNSAARGEIAFKFHKVVLCGSGKAAELSKPTKARIQYGGRRRNFLHTDPDISWTAKARDFIFHVCASTTRSNFDGMQKSRSKGTWPSLGNLDLNSDPCEYLSKG